MLFRYKQYESSGGAGDGFVDLYPKERTLVSKEPNIWRNPVNIHFNISDLTEDNRYVYNLQGNICGYSLALQRDTTVQQFVLPKDVRPL